MAIWMPMTAVPQRTALSHAFGALAAALVGIAHYYEPHGITIDRFTMGVLAIEVLLGSLTFTGSLVAFGKLQELIPSSIKGLPNQNIINFALLGAAILCGIWLIFNPNHYVVFLLLVLLGLSVRPVPRDADWRGRHAHRDLAAQFVRRPVGQHDGFRARQLPA